VQAPVQAPMQAAALPVPLFPEGLVACRVAAELRSAGSSNALGVAFDEDLANRSRELVAHERGISEKRMFGGLAFLVDGHMAVSASGPGGLLVRVHVPLEAKPEKADELEQGRAR
jgi:TfoX N-terminal domain